MDVSSLSGFTVVNCCELDENKWGGGHYGSMQINDSDSNIWCKQVIVPLQSSSAVEQLASTSIHSFQTKEKNETNVEKRGENRKTGNQQITRLIEVAEKKGNFQSELLNLIFYTVNHPRNVSLPAPRSADTNKI